MAGGIWTSQNKVQPGVYINTKSQGNLPVSFGEKGVVAIAEPLSWGPAGVIREIIPGEDLRPYIGYDITSEKALFLREIMKGSDTTDGPVKILLYRPAGAGGGKAAAEIGSLTVTALCEGRRGNDITVIVAGDPDREGVFDVSTIIDGIIADTQSVTDAKELSENDWVVFSGSGTLEDHAGVPLTGGADPKVTSADYAQFLQVLEPYPFDILIYDGTDSVVIQAMAAFVKRVSEGAGFKCQAVMAEAQSCDSEWVISVNNGVKLSDGTILTPQQAVWWLGGAEAGARYHQSLTYARYPGAVEAFPKLTDTQITEAVQAGEIVFIDNFGTVKVCTDVNTFTSFTAEKQKDYSKNRVMRVLNQFCNDVYREFSLYYIGKVDNTEAGRNLLKGWITGYFNEMQANGGIRDFSPDDVTVRQGEERDSVVVHTMLQPVDSIEKIYITVTVTANTAET